MKIKFTSSVPIELYDELEILLYFNFSQKKYVSYIEKAIREYGMPKIIKKNYRLYIELDNKIESHTLFLIKQNDKKIDTLECAAIFLKEDKHNAILLHIIKSSNEENYYVLKLLMKVKEYLSNFKEIEFIKIFYSKSVIKLRIRN